MVDKLQARFGHLIHLLHGAGSYAMLVLVIPGGSLVAAALWLYRHRAALVQTRTLSWLIASARRAGSLLRTLAARLRRAATPPCPHRRRPAAKPPLAVRTHPCHAKF